MAQCLLHSMFYQTCAESGRDPTLFEEILDIWCCIFTCWSTC